MISIASIVVGWFLVAIIFFIIYKNQQIKPLWKVIPIFIIGMISFHWDWHFHDTIIHIPTFPIGVVIILLEAKIKGNPWPKHQIVAWSGFISAFVFVITSLIAIPVQNALYPSDNISTYIASTENVSIIRTYTPARKQSLDKASVQEQMDHMEPKSIHSEQWYGDMVMDNEPEHFPYQLTGISPKWGSGESAIIYVEEDGKGLLVITPNSQHYFRTDDSMFQEGSSP